jgi:hypothetical protein
MAILKVPRLNTLTRVNLTLEASEIVYDTDVKAFFGGDGAVVGGIELGSQGGIRFYREEINLNDDQILSGTILLQKAPDTPSSVRFVPKHGIEQDYNDDFIVNGNEVIFKNLGLDGFLESGETVYIYYTELPNAVQ